MENILFLLYPLTLLSPRFILPALGLHALFIARTAHQYERIPLIGMRDTLGFLAFAIGVIYAVAAWKRRRDLFTYLIIPLILLLLGASLVSPPSSPGPMPPVLRTAWFELHVVLSFVSYAL